MNNQTYEELKKRELERCYIVIYTMDIQLYITDDNGNVNPKDAYILFGCDTKGKRKYITSVLSDDVKKTSDWYNLFQMLKKRKMEHIVFGLLPEKKELREAIRLAFPKIEIFDSCEGIVKKLQQYSPVAEKDQITFEIKELYLAEDIDEYKMNYDNFIKKYENCPFIMDLLIDKIKKIEKNYKYSLELRKVIYAFFFIRSLDKKLIILSHKQYYHNVDEFMEKTLKDIQTCEKYMHCSRVDWIEVINEIYSEKKEILKYYL